MKLVNTICPNCSATLKVKDISSFACDYCGSQILIDDEASEYNRMLLADSEAKQRNSTTEIEKEKELLKIRSKEKIVDALTSDPSQTLKTAGAVLKFFDRLL